MAETRTRNRNATTRRSVSRDRSLVSDQPWEVEQIHKHFPEHSHEQVVHALEQCKRDLGGSEDRTKVMDCMKGRLTMGNAK